MAHRIISKPAGVMLTCKISKEFHIEVDGSFVDVRLSGPFNLTVLEERYYAFGDNTYLYDIGSLIESDMRANGYCYEDYTLSLLNESKEVVDSCVFHALYCDRFTVSTLTDVFLQNNFLTTLPFRRMPQTAILSLFYFSNPGDNTTARIAYKWRSSATADNVQVGSFDINGQGVEAPSVVQIDVSIPNIAYQVSRAYNLPLYSIEIVSFSVTIGDRSLSCFIDKSLSQDETFYFRNCFNVWDTACLPLSTTAKTEVERSFAVVNDRSRFYNQKVVKTYEVETGPLTSDEASWIDQLFTSYEVLRQVPNDCDELDPYIGEQVLITDTSCEISDTDEKPNNVKFTWRYADNRPIVRLSASQGIFTDPYNFVFS